MRVWLFVVAVLSAAACGDNTFPVGAPLDHAGELAIIAHEDDDLLFMQPQLYDAVQRGTGLTNVYVTAGNGQHGLSFVEARYRGLMAAYASVADAKLDAWQCGWIDLAGHAAEHCRLDAAKLSLVFLGYPDGDKDGSAPDSLLHLWEGKITRATTLARVTTTYNQAELIATVAAIIDATAPATLHTLEVSSTHGHDHADHMLVGALSVLATAASASDPELLSYRGYNIADEPANNDPALYDRSVQALAHYEACTKGCAPCGRACTIDQLDPAHTDWLRRRYAIGMRRSADGQLHLGAGCVSITTAGANATIIDCASAPTWHLGDHGFLQASNGLCLDAILTGEIVAGTCGQDGVGGRFFLDDEGHLWSGIVPPRTATMDLAHLSCVIDAGGRPRAALCGGDNAPTVELTQATTVTVRDTITITRTGRAVRLARLDRNPLPTLCAIETGVRGLMCASGTTGGGFLPATRLDRMGALAIDPDSLAFGDVDGDQRLDACGSDANGLLCATAASGYQPARWTPLLASAPDSPTARSLAITPRGEICGLSGAGVVCVTHGATVASDVRSTWPDRGAALWFADLDGDREPDWCVATPAGAACSLAADRAITTSGVPWSYARQGLVEASQDEGSVLDDATAVFTDIDGDGRDDLCTIHDGAIACARSLRRGFAPRVTIARLPAGMAPTALWAEPGAPRVAAGQPPTAPPRLCAADAATIACTVAH